MTAEGRGRGRRRLKMWRGAAAAEAETARQAACARLGVVAPGFDVEEACNDIRNVLSVMRALSACRAEEVERPRQGAGGRRGWRSQARLARLHFVPGAGGGGRWSVVAFSFDSVDVPCRRPASARFGRRGGWAAWGRRERCATARKAESHCDGKAGRWRALNVLELRASAPL